MNAYLVGFTISLPESWRIRPSKQQMVSRERVRRIEAGLVTSTRPFIFVSDPEEMERAWERSLHALKSPDRKPSQ